MTVFYKQGTDDLAILMQKYLMSEDVEKETNSEKISEAVDYMMKAAEIFESLQDKQASEAITVILEKMAG
jgi:hypothetical protein